MDIDTNPAAYFPIALSNRFELAPADGANCGEYRVIYARRSGLLQARNRNLFIFEAVMPNPSPKLGLRGCRKIARFWASLSKENDIERRADRLEKFYFDGLKGLPPVIKISHYGANNKGEGRIRTNQFLEQKRFEEGNPARFWILREFKMNLECSSKKYRSCQSFTIVPEPVEDNPFGGLFSPNSTDERAPLFKEIFISQIPNLAANTIADINMEIPDIFYAADSISLNPTVDNYVAQLGTGPSDFRSKIEAKLTEIGSPLTADNIVARAQALSCAGCHKLNDNLNIGGGLIWPSSAPTREPGTADGFIHVTERFTEVVDGVTRFVISPALMNEFLPSRKKVLDDYLNNTLRHYKDKHQAIGGRRVH